MHNWQSICKLHQNNLYFKPWDRNCLAPVPNIVRIIAMASISKHCEGNLWSGQLKWLEHSVESVCSRFKYVSKIPSVYQEHPFVSWKWFLLPVPLPYVILNYFLFLGKFGVLFALATSTNISNHASLLNNTAYMPSACKGHLKQCTKMSYISWSIWQEYSW